jgi:hypothetical protein
MDDAPISDVTGNVGAHRHVIVGTPSSVTEAIMTVYREAGGLGTPLARCSALTARTSRRLRTIR